MSAIQEVLARGDRASQPAANTVPQHSLYYVTDEFVTEQSDGADWQPYSTSGVTVTGTPASGNLAKFTSGTSVENTNLSGFVTTTDTSVTSLSAAGAAEIAYNKAFFSAASILPANERVAAGLVTAPGSETTVTHTYTDTAGLGGAVITGTQPGITYWDLGALRSEVLFVIGGMFIPTGGSLGMTLSASAPASADPDHYGFYFGANSYTFRIYKEVSTVYTQLSTDVTGLTNLGTYWPGGMAFYYNDTTDTLSGYIRVSNWTWHRLLTLTDTSFTTVRYVGLRSGVANTRIFLPITAWSS